MKTQETTGKITALYERLSWDDETAGGAQITGEDGQIRKSCTVIKKGEVYESHLFTVKDDRFKSEAFLREV